MTIITKPKNTLAIIVDQLGAIKAQIASLEEAESALKARLVASGQTEIDGTLFRATVRQSERWTLDRKLVEKAYAAQHPAAKTGTEGAAELCNKI